MSMEKNMKMVVDLSYATFDKQKEYSDDEGTKTHANAHTHTHTHKHTHTHTCVHNIRTLPIK